MPLKLGAAVTISDVNREIVAHSCRCFHKSSMSIRYRSGSWHDQQAG